MAVIEAPPDNLFFPGDVDVAGLLDEGCAVVAGDVAARERLLAVSDHSSNRFGVVAALALSGSLPAGVLLDVSVTMDAGTHEAAFHAIRTMAPFLPPAWFDAAARAHAERGLSSDRREVRMQAAWLLVSQGERATVVAWQSTMALSCMPPRDCAAWLAPGVATRDEARAAWEKATPAQRLAMVDWVADGRAERRWLARQLRDAPEPLQVAIRRRLGHPRD